MAFLPWDGEALSAPVGNNQVNVLEDIVNVKRRFARAGRYNRPVENGYIDGELVNAIHGIQKDHGLRRDGYMLPGGETEAALTHEVAKTDRRAEVTKIAAAAPAAPAAAEALMVLGPATAVMLSEWLKKRRAENGAAQEDQETVPAANTPNGEPDEKAHCDTQYSKDMGRCSKAYKDFGPRAYSGCKACAEQRYGECMANKPLRQLLYWTGGD